MNPDLSVVIPTYNSASSLDILLDRLEAVLLRRNISFEIVLVNDASPDDTFAVLSKMIQDRPYLRVIDLQINHGQARATMCGLAYASGRLVATMDDDLQQPPEELPTLLDALETHPDWDAVVGSWKRDEGLLRNFGSWVHAAADRLAYGTPREWRHTTFRVMRRPVIDALVANETRTPVVTPLLRQVASRVHNVEVEHHDRPHGSSGFRMIHGVRTVAGNFLSASTLPLRALWVFGVLSSVVAFLVGLVYLVGWALGRLSPPPGFLSTFLIVTFFGGATLFGMGLLGEYMALIMREVRRPPRWAIRQIIGGESTKDPDSHALRADPLAVRPADPAVEQAHR